MLATFISFHFGNLSSERINRRPLGKSDSLLISLLKQEAIADSASNQMLASTVGQPIVAIQRDKFLDDALLTYTNKFQLKLEADFIIKKPKPTKKTSNKTQVNVTIRTFVNCRLF